MQASVPPSPPQSQPTPLPFTLLSPSHYPKRQFQAVLPILRRLARQSTNSLKLPVMRALATVGKLFQLSHIEALFLGYLLRETEWSLRDRAITKYAPSVRDVLYTYVCDLPEYKSLVLYLTLACYSIKESLSQSAGGEFLNMAKCICPHFQAAYGEWSVRYAGYTSRIRPQTINALHKELMTTHQDEDYSSVVDEIIAISDQYDYERKLRRVLAKRILQVRMEQANSTIPRADKSLPKAPKEVEGTHEKFTGKLEFEFQSKFFSHFVQDNLMQLVNVGTTNDVQEDFMLSPEDDRAIGCFRGHSDPLSEDEQCQQANLPPLYDDRAMFLPPPEDLSRDLELASYSDSNFGLFALPRGEDDDFP